ncbi:hypothetical protein BDN70DRAFT_24189 [Pholiota conissans]|uniref:Secreted protein n=1 Tax=Pholiota conissans TaxID=109636 RepID=A0A9P5ZDW6_9AGAR|nr:hypothetical protein BDN70DRAFT_24189 [Pholiota conissans]
MTSGLRCVASFSLACCVISHCPSPNPPLPFKEGGTHSQSQSSSHLNIFHLSHNHIRPIIFYSITPFTERQTYPYHTLARAG